MEEDCGAELRNSLKESEVAQVSADHEERRRKNMACGHWVPDLHLVKVVQLKGNFWKNHGFSFESSDYLYPEEAMFLHERQQIYVQMGETVLDKRSLYELVLSSMPHACYLTYLKLKTLEYICLRHTRELRCFTVVQDVYDYLVQHPTSTLLDCLVSFKVYAYDSKIFKRNLPETVPTSYVVVMSGEAMLSPRIVLKLLEEAKGIPVMFSILLPSGNVVLEEFTDAQSSLKWKKGPFSFDK